MNPDLMGGELLKKTGGGNLFMVFGESDVNIKEEGRQLIVELRGLDVYDPTIRHFAPVGRRSRTSTGCFFMVQPGAGDRNRPQPNRNQDNQMRERHPRVPIRPTPLINRLLTASRSSRMPFGCDVEWFDATQDLVICAPCWAVNGSRQRRRTR